LLGRSDLLVLFLLQQFLAASSATGETLATSNLTAGSILACLVTGGVDGNFGGGIWCDGSKVQQPPRANWPCVNSHRPARQYRPRSSVAGGLGLQVLIGRGPPARPKRAATAPGGAFTGKQQGSRHHLIGPSEAICRRCVTSTGNRKVGRRCSRGGNSNRFKAEAATLRSGVSPDTDGVG